MPLISEPLTVDCLCDGWPCPYCGDITTADDDGIWVCLCGWSGVLVLLPD